MQDGVAFVRMRHLGKIFNTVETLNHIYSRTKFQLSNLHVRLTDLHAAHQNLPLPPNRTLPLKQYQYKGRL